jgi:hypothetical protein
LTKLNYVETFTALQTGAALIELLLGLEMKDHRKLNYSRLASILPFAIALQGSAGAMETVEMHRHPQPPSIEDKAPTGKGQGVTAPANAARGAAATNGISYHYGPVMTNGATVKMIWYGNWSDTGGQSILTDLVNSIGASPWYNITSSYYQQSCSRIALGVCFGTLGPIVYASNAITKTVLDATDRNSAGLSFSDASLQQYIASTIQNDPNRSPNTIYALMAGPDVDETSGLCTKYCGFHNKVSVKINGVTSVYKYIFVGNANRCMTACAAQSTSPNGNPAVDAMANILSHELTETATDPQLNAWYDSSGSENADKCAWSFGATNTAPNGSQYNVTLSNPVTNATRQYLIQQNWVNAGGGKCALSYP